MPLPRPRWAPYVVAVALTLGSLPLAAQQAVAPVSAKTSAAAAPAPRWIGPDGRPLPWQSADEALEFLRRARIGKATGTKRGITQPRKMELERDGIRADAIFHDVNEDKRNIRLRSGEHILNFRDCYLFQIAAFELARLLGMQNVPPSVKRTFAGKTGSMTLWLEGMITDEMRREQKREPEGAEVIRWNRQMTIMHVWDNLIYNFDRNQGNILLDKDWNVWLIDHTRAFRRDHSLPRPEQLTSCERGFFERLRALDPALVKKRLKGHLGPAEIEALLKRRDLIVAHFEKLAHERGEDKVFFTYP